MYSRPSVLARSWTGTASRTAAIVQRRRIASVNAARTISPNAAAWWGAPSGTSTISSNVASIRKAQASEEIGSEWVECAQPCQHRDAHLNPVRAGIRRPP